MREELAAIVKLLSARAEITLDELSDAIGEHAVSYDEVDALMHALESRGVRIVGPEGGGGEERLFVVLGVARVLAKELGRRPSVDEISARASMPRELVWRALLLAQVMGRP
mgnify:CR=1 FL=1